MEELHVCNVTNKKYPFICLLLIYILLPFCMWLDEYLAEYLNTQVLKY